MNICDCGHGLDRHFDCPWEDSGGNMRGDWGCWDCEDENKTCNRRFMK